MSGGLPTPTYQEVKKSLSAEEWKMCVADVRDGEGGEEGRRREARERRRWKRGNRVRERRKGDSERVKCSRGT